MKKTTLATSTLLALSLSATASAQNQDNVKVGVIGGITGPIANMAPAMIDAAELAIKHVNDQGGLSSGAKIEAVTYDSACNPQGATDAATKAVNVDSVIGIVGPHCSGAVIAAANSVTVPSDTIIITPSGTSPEITNIDDNDLVFRTVASDAYQGIALARTLYDRGTSEIAVTYLNNDYGKGLADAFKNEFESLGGTISGYAAHEEGNSTYRTNLADLADQGADTLAIFDYGDGSGLTILREALENGFFENYIGGDGMRSEALIDGLGADNLTNFYASSPSGTDSRGLDILTPLLEKDDNSPDNIFTTNEYDAAFLMALAIEKANGEKSQLSGALRDVATAPGEVIYPGEWEKARKLLANGDEIDYQGGAGDHEFNDDGDVPGSYTLYKVEDDKFVPEVSMDSQDDKEESDKQSEKASTESSTSEVKSDEPSEETATETSTKSE